MQTKEPSMPVRIIIASAFIFALFLSGCAGVKQAEKQTDTRTISGNYPRVVAVVPFGNETDELGISGLIRRSFYNHFSSKPFQDIELSVTDAKVAAAEKTSGKTVFEMPPKEIADSIGAEGVIYGKVTDFQKVFAVAYSQIGAEAEVWMVDARTGQELWRIRESVRYHEGGIPLTPLGAVMTIVSTAVNIRDIQQVRVINELGWKLNEKIAAPEGFKFEGRPVIKNVISNAKEGPFGKGKTIKIAMEGDKGLIGLFDIPGFKMAIPFKEVAPGEYLGEYMVVPGDNVKEAPLIAYLRRPTGEEGQWFDISGFLTVDTTPPPPAADLKGRAFIDRVELSWKGVSAPDLKGYKVLRSKKPLSDFEMVALTEVPVFTDKLIEPKEAYYYRVASIDAAGNESERTEPVRLSLRERELVELSGTIERDTTLNAGLYLVKGVLVVASGVTLTVSPDTKIYFEKDAAIKALGSLNAQGEADLWIEFLPRTPEERYIGISLEGGSPRLRYARIQGAQTAISVKDTPLVIANSVFENNSTAIHARGTPSPKITDSTIWHNIVGVRADDSNALFSRNEITRNASGMIAVNSHIEASDNNIYANETNAEFTGHAVLLDGNYLGSINTEEMRLKGDVKAVRVLDGPYPNGKPVDAVMNPYAMLTPEERKARLAEFLMKGGKYFKESNFGKAASTFEEAQKIEESPTTYYYLALSYQGMDDGEKALSFLKKGSEKYPMDSVLIKSYGLLLYELNRMEQAREALKEAIRLNPGDKQIKFILERMESK